MMNKKGLGRGLDAIFELEGGRVPVRQSASTMEEIAVALISPNPKQPRTHFDEDALGELADSIKVLGVIQPITVKRSLRRLPDGTKTPRWVSASLSWIEAAAVSIRAR